MSILVSKIPKGSYRLLAYLLQLLTTKTHGNFVFLILSYNFFELAVMLSVRLVTIDLQNFPVLAGYKVAP